MEYNPVDYPGRGAPIYGPLPPRRDLWTYGDLAKFALFSLAAQVPSAIVAIIARPILISLAEPYLGLSHDSQAVKGAGVVVAVALSSLASFGYIYYVIAIKCRLPFPGALGFTPFQRYMGWFVVVGAVISVAEGLVGGLIGTPDDTSFAELLRDQTTYWLLGIAAVLIAPLLEEALFRGFLYRPLEESWGPIGAIAVTSVVFSVLHGPQYNWSWQILLMLALSGLCLGVARWRTRSLWPPILMHAGSNLVSVAATGLENFV